MNHPKPKRTPPATKSRSEAKKGNKAFDPVEAAERIKRLTTDIENLAHRQLLTTANKTSIQEDAEEIRDLIEQIAEHGFKQVSKKKSRFIESTDESDGPGDDDGHTMAVDGPTVSPSDRPSAPITASISTQTDGLEPVTLRQLRIELSKLKLSTEPERSTSQPTQPQSDPNWGLPVNRPAVIISAVDPRVKSYSDVLSQFKSGVDFTTKDFGPIRTKPLAQNKVRVEFSSESQRDLVINELSSSTTAIKAESARRIRPLVMLKGIPTEINKEDVVGIIARQNPSLGIKSAEEAKLRFARNNRSPTMYNAVIEVCPSVRKAIFELQDARIHVSHLRVRATEYVAYTQCYKCLQFGHTSARCTSELSVCSHCASDGHKFANCPSRNDPSKAKCINCSKTTQRGIPLDPSAICHSATSESQCPRIHSIIRHLRSITDYGITESRVTATIQQPSTQRRMSFQRPRTDSTVSTGSRRSKGRPSKSNPTVSKQPSANTGPSNNAGPSNSETPAQTRM